uniref:Complex I intermediate-associated protein 30, mitochondrial n=1 Tax=Labrus bergylta TaxID=56723 RepID=A0A3Q3EG18_9LABR
VLFPSSHRPVPVLTPSCSSSCSRPNTVLFSSRSRQTHPGAHVEQNRLVWEFRVRRAWRRVVSSDKEIGGHSEAYLKLGKNNKHLFLYGTLSSTPPRDERDTLQWLLQHASFDRKKHHDWTSFNTLHLRVRGDGPWMINLATETYFSHQKDDDVKVSTESIPFSKFFLTHRGRLQDDQHHAWLDKVNTVGFTLGDKADGPSSWNRLHRRVQRFRSPPRSSPTRCTRRIQKFERTPSVLRPGLVS